MGDTKQMKFTVAGSRIICSRMDNTIADENVYRHVVEFDAHVKSIPPHVSAKLVSSEVEQLREFMADRRRIQANPAVVNVLEALPGLLDKATEALSSVERVNKTMYDRLAAAVAKTSLALDRVKPVPQGEPTPVKNMRFSEAQKERLRNIKQDH